MFLLEFPVAFSSLRRMGANPGRRSEPCRILESLAFAADGDLTPPTQVYVCSVSLQKTKVRMGSFHCRLTTLPYSSCPLWSGRTCLGKRCCVSPLSCGDISHADGTFRPENVVSLLVHSYRGGAAAREVAEVTDLPNQAIVFI